MQHTCRPCANFRGANELLKCVSWHWWIRGIMVALRQPWEPLRTGNMCETCEISCHHKLSSQVSLRPPEIQLTGKDDCARWSDSCWFRWFSWWFSVTMVQPGHCSLCCTWTCRRCCSPWLVLPQTPNLPDPSWNLSRACNFSCARIWDSCCWSWICHNCCCTCHASCSKGSCAFTDSVSTSHSNRNLD